MPDIPTLPTLLALDALLCSLAWLTIRAGHLRDGQAVWIAGLIALAAGWGAEASTVGWLAPFSPVWFSVGLACTTHAVFRLGRKPGHRTALFAPPVCIGLIQALGTHAPPLLASSIAPLLAAQLFLCAWPLTGHPGEIARPLRFVTCAAFLLGGLGVLADALPAARHLLSTSSLAWGSLVLLFVANVGIAMLYCERARLESERLASRDPLTGLFNRRSFITQTGRELLRARRCDAPVSALMIDIDHFKEINDRAGHLAGDRVLRHFAGHLRATLREQDLCARHDRDTFCALLPDTPPEGAQHLAERLLQSVSESRVAPDDIAYTASIGIAAILHDEGTPLPMLGRAERALREAKRQGRNRIVLHDTEAHVT